MTSTCDRSEPPPGPPPPDGPSPGGRERFDRLFVEIQAELRKLAHRLLKRNGRVDDVHTTVLVQDMYVKLSASHANAWNSPQELETAAAEILRNLLTDAARRRESRKRGGGAKAEDLEIVLAHYEGRGPEGLAQTDLLDLDAALKSLAAQDAKVAKMVELHYYLGVDDEEIGRVFQVSPRTVFSRLERAKSFLKRYMDRTARPPPLPPDIPM